MEGDSLMKRLADRAAARDVAPKRADVDAKLAAATEKRDSLLYDKWKHAVSELAHARAVRRTREAQLDHEARMLRERIDAKMGAAEERHRAALEERRRAAGAANARVVAVTTRQKRRFEPPSPEQRPVYVAPTSAPPGGGGEDTGLTASPVRTGMAGVESDATATPWKATSPPRARARLDRPFLPGPPALSRVVTAPASLAELSPPRRCPSDARMTWMDGWRHGPDPVALDVPALPDDGFALDGDLAAPAFSPRDTHASVRTTPSTVRRGGTVAGGAGLARALSDTEDEGAGAGARASGSLDGVPLRRSLSESARMTSHASARAVATAVWSALADTDAEAEADADEEDEADGDESADDTAGGAPGAVDGAEADVSEGDSDSDCDDAGVTRMRAVMRERDAALPETSPLLGPSAAPTRRALERMAAAVPSEPSSRPARRPVSSSVLASEASTADAPITRGEAGAHVRPVAADATGGGLMGRLRSPKRTPTDIWEEMQAKMAAASKAREAHLRERAQANRVRDVQRSMRVASTVVQRSLEAREHRQRIDNAITTAQARREAQLSSVVERARAHADSVEARRERVSAARRLQKRWRRAHSPSRSPRRPADGGDGAADAGAAGGGLAGAARPSAASIGAPGPAAATGPNGVREPYEKVRRLFAGKKLSGACAMITKVIDAAQPPADVAEAEEGASAAGAHISDGATDGAAAGSFPADDVPLPTPSREEERTEVAFERAARAIQAPEALAAARTLLIGMARTAEGILLDAPIELVPPTGFGDPRSTAGVAAVTSPPASPAGPALASASGAPPRRPDAGTQLVIMAKSARTLLAALLIANFPSQMMAGSDDKSSSSAASAAGGAGEAAGTASAGQEEEEGDAEAARISRARESRLVETATELVFELRRLASMPKRKADGAVARGPGSVASQLRRARAALAAYQQAFIEWKVADGARSARALVPTLASLEVTRRTVHTKNMARAKHGQSPADLQMLAGVEAHLKLVRKQLVNMVGSVRAAELEKAAVAAADALWEAQGGAEAAAAEAHKNGMATRRAGSSDDDESGVGSSAPISAAASATEAAPAPAASMPSLSASRSALDNEVIVHRLCIDPTWRLPVPTPAEGLAWDEDIEVMGLEDGERVDASTMLEAAVEEVDTSLFTDVDASDAGTSPAGPETASGARAGGAGGAGGSAVVDGAVSESDVEVEVAGSHRAPAAAAAGTEPQVAGVEKTAGSRRASDSVSGAGRGSRPGTKPPTARVARRSPALWLAALQVLPLDKSSRIVGRALRSIKDQLIALTPRRRDLQAEVETSVDERHVATQMARGVYSARSLAALAVWIAERISSLEAPARQDESRAWQGAARTAIVESAVWSWGSDDRDAATAAAAAGADAPPSREAVARVLAWAFYKLDQLRMDVSNFHLSTLAPYLARGGKGAEYERRKFEDALARGGVGLIGTNAWLQETVQEIVKDGKAALQSATPSNTNGTGSGAGGSTQDATTRFLGGLHVDDAGTRHFVLGEGVLRLLQRDSPATVDAAAGALAHALSSRAGVEVRVGVRTTDASAASMGEGSSDNGGVSDSEASTNSTMRLPRPFPETLRLDAAAIEETQNTVQRVAIVSTLVATVKQVLGAVRRRSAGAEPPAGGAPVDVAASLSAAGVVGRGASSLEELTRQIDAWLRGDSVTHAHIVDGLVNSVRALAVHTVGPAARLTPAEENMVRVALATGADASNPMFALFLKRTVAVLRAEMRAQSAGRMGPRSCAGDLAAALAPATDPSRTAGLAWAVPELKAKATGLVRIVAHSDAVHGARYALMLKGIGLRSGHAPAAPVAVSPILGPRPAPTGGRAAGAAPAGGAGVGADAGETSESDDEL